MTDTATAALITAVASFIVAVVSGGIALWNGRKTSENSLDIASLNGTLGRDLERLKAKLAHGQLISSTQWNAEFTAYQAIWKEMCVVRSMAPKLAHRENEWKQLGLSETYVSVPERIEIRKELISKFIDAAGRLFSAIHNSAPFYPAPIREEANNTQGAAKDLIDKHLAAFIEFADKRVDITADPTFIAESETTLRAILEGVDRVEALMRDRLSDVQVVNGASPLD